MKASQFSFSRLHKADPVLGVDMSSTGEVGCIGDDFSEALLNAMIATGFKIPEKAVMFSSGAMKSKVDLLMRAVCCLPRDIRFMLLPERLHS